MCQSSQTSGLREKFDPWSMLMDVALKLSLTLMRFDSEWCDLMFKVLFVFFGIDKNLIMDLRNNSRFFSNDGLAAVKRLAQHCYEMI